MPKIRKFTAEEWKTYKNIRLQALADSPDAFGTTLPEAQEHTGAKWPRFFAAVYLTAFRFGSNLAALRFFLGAKLPVGQMLKATREVNLPRERSSEPYISNNENSRTGQITATRYQMYVTGL